MRNGDRQLVQANGKPTTVLTILDEMRGRWNKAETARRRARLIERYTYNRIDNRILALEGSVSVPFNIPPVSKNKLKNLALTWSSRLTRNRNTSIAFAHDASDDDLASAEAANAILENLRQLQNRDTLLSRAGVVAAMHGTVAFYNPYDPDHGPHRERTPKLHPTFQTPMVNELGEALYEESEGTGAPHVEMLTIFDFITSGEREANKGKWLLVRRWLDEDEAEGILRASIEAAVAKGEEPPYDTKVSTEPIMNHQQTGPTRDLVECWEMWWRPNKLGRFKDGLFAAVVSGKVTNAIPFPYDHGELPIAVWRVMDVEEDFYGATWMEDALPQQLGLNHSLRVLAHRAEIAGQARLLGMPGVLSKWGESPDGFVECSTTDEIEGGVRLFEGADIPKDMYEMVDRYEQGIDDTAGVSGVASSGDTAAQTKNARLVAYATQVDEQKNEQSQRNLEEAELIIDSQDLKLVQQYWSRQRLIRVIGEDNAPAAAYFSGADIMGVDVILEPAPGSERSRAAQGKDTEEAAAAGYIDPTRAGEMRTTGLPSTIDDGESRERLQGLVQQALAGVPTQADLLIPSQIAIPELRRLLGTLAPHGARATMPIRALLQEYESQKQQDQHPMPDQMPGKPGTPGQMGGQNKAQQGNTLPQLSASKGPSI